MGGLGRGVELKWGGGWELNNAGRGGEGSNASLCFHISSKAVDNSLPHPNFVFYFVFYFVIIYPFLFSLAPQVKAYAEASVAYCGIPHPSHMLRSHQNDAAPTPNGLASSG